MSNQANKPRETADVTVGLVYNRQNAIGARRPATLFHRYNNRPVNRYCTAHCTTLFAGLQLCLQQLIPLLLVLAFYVNQLVRCKLWDYPMALVFLQNIIEQGSF
jgi:hypothetical protein